MEEIEPTCYNAFGLMLNGTVRPSVTMNPRHPHRAGNRISARLWLAAGLLLAFFVSSAGAVDLQRRYPTSLTGGDSSPDHARSWEFTEADLFRLMTFKFKAAHLQIEIGPADMGVGHSADGAVWAVVVPKESGTLTSEATGQSEALAHVWLRFHPKEIGNLFPTETIRSDGETNLVTQMRVIASAKFSSSWHVGMNALIPEPKDLIVDVDTTNAVRRYFVVDKEAQRVQYLSAFESRSVRLPPALTRTMAQEAFDKLWEAFDQDYAMFLLRPEVDWNELRQQYRPKALTATSVYEFAGVCAEMLKQLRDLHVWLTVADSHVLVFKRLRSANVNPAGVQALVGALHDAGRRVRYAITPDRIGYLTVLGWDDRAIPNQCDEALEQMRDTRGLIFDVRLNGGGSEDLAREVAGRFLPKSFVYAYSQFRNGPNHTNLTAKLERAASPRGPWRYSRPVLLLIGQKCMSSNESFVSMMTGDPDLTTMGDRTCGSSGNPRLVQLPLAITVSVPRWIDYLPDGTPLAERGIQPQAPFEPESGAFEGQRDDLLKAAIDRLCNVILPKL